MTYTSPDGEEGYPGKVEAKVTYEIVNQNDIQINISATSDKATPINITCHPYFNLAGHVSFFPVVELTFLRFF